MVFNLKIFFSEEFFHLGSYLFAFYNFSPQIFKFPKGGEYECFLRIVYCIEGTPPDVLLETAENNLYGT